MLLAMNFRSHNSYVHKIVVKLFTMLLPNEGNNNNDNDNKHNSNDKIMMIMITKLIVIIKIMIRTMCLV